MTSSRSELIVQLTQKDRVRVDELNIPKYESTKGTDIKDINIEKLKSTLLGKKKINYILI